MTTPEPAALADGLSRGERGALARAITLIESRRHDHRAHAEALMQQVLSRTGRAIRLGISGVPGVGKSTLIEALGTRLIEKGHRIAVLAVDPSSRKSGGSILGDKTRMATLGLHTNAYVRPSPTGGHLGGVARTTREAVLLCEAAGFDVVIVETVGVGQSETAVADMVDGFLMLMLPNAGDELQGIKKGVLEIADLLAVNKADGEQVRDAKRARAAYQRALDLLTPEDDWRPRALTVSAQSGDGLDELWAAVLEHRTRLDANGGLERRRARQRVAWLRSTLEQRLLDALTDSRHRTLREDIEADVAAGTLAVPLGASRLAEAIRDG